MSTVSPPESPEQDPRVKAVFDDIRATRQSDFINNMWRYLAFDPALLESTWAEVKRVMATPSSLDPLTKQLLCALPHGGGNRQRHDARTTCRVVVHRGVGFQDQPVGHRSPSACGPGL